jgi:hypothetical protein
MPNTIVLPVIDSTPIGSVSISMRSGPGDRPMQSHGHGNPPPQDMFHVSRAGETRFHHNMPESSRYALGRLGKLR